MAISSATLTDKESLALEHLRHFVESSSHGWGNVYLDNARPPQWDEKTWSGVLGSLTKKGLYQPEWGDEGCFGDVKL